MLTNVKVIGATTPSQAQTALCLPDLRQSLRLRRSKSCRRIRGVSSGSAEALYSAWQVCDTLVHRMQSAKVR